MNTRGLFKSARIRLAQSTVAVFGEREDGNYLWGTGILMDLRGTPLVLTCAHVLDPIHGIPYLTAGRYTHQAEAVHLHRFSNPKLDAACLVLRDPQRVFAGSAKEFISASTVLTQTVDLDDEVYVHGFPIGHKGLQLGGRVDPAAREAHFTSMTYFTLGAVPMLNKTIGFRQPCLEWNYGRNKDAKRFALLPKDLTKEERGGFSGGPVVAGLGGVPGRLCGQITHASGDSLFYNPIAHVLDWADKTI